MINYDGESVLIDFDRSTILPEGIEELVVDFYGSLSYCFRDQAEHGLASVQTDLYSLTITLYELRASRPAPRGSKWWGMKWELTNDCVVTCSNSKEFKEMLVKCLEKGYRSVDELKVDYLQTPEVQEALG